MRSSPITTPPLVRIAEKMGNSQTLPEEGSTENSELFIEVDKQKWPILYSPDYDISFWKLETIHPFDSTKWKRVFQILVDRQMVKGLEDTVQPREASASDLLVVHTRGYLESLNVRILYLLYT